MRNLFIILFSFTFSASAQKYSVALLPDSLLKHADAVLRFDETRIIIHSISSATVQHKYVYTILNEGGSYFAEYHNRYDNFTKLSESSGKLYDAFGKQLKTVKKKEMQDVPYDDNMSLVLDDRVRDHNFYCKNYPYTIEYEEEEDYKGVLVFPAWRPLHNYNYSVQNSSYTVEIPTDYKLRYKLVNAAGKPVITEKGKSKILAWQAANIKAIEHETLQPSINNIVPVVLIGPDDFEFGGYKGNLSTWNNFGKYFNDLLKDRDILPDNIKTEVHKLTDGLQNRNEKIKVLYDFLQQNTHYISIQLGIGGFQPFDAKYVAEKKYGDCKALSNYMVSMLKEAGVKAYSAIIFGGENFPYVYEDFPNDYFNHVVACVPSVGDTIWLECTDQYKSAGYAGTFTGNRKALLITEDGGRLVNTPHYSANDNLQVRKINAIIDEEGNLAAEFFTHTTGIQQETQHDLLHLANPEQREKYLNRTLNLPTYKVEKIDYEEVKGVIPAMNETLKITSPNYASVTGRRLFVLPNLFNKTEKLPENKERHFDIVFNTAWKDVDSVYITLPSGYTVEALPKNVSLENKFGSYEISFKVKDNRIEMIRAREQPEATFPAAEYQQLVDYFDTISKADRSKIVMVKN